MQPVHRTDVNAGFRVSVLAVGFTLATSAAAISLGIATSTVVLVAFGAIGLLDAIGSVALAYHFRHALRHDVLSDDLERIAHHVVLVGLLVVGASAFVAGVTRFALRESSSTSTAGIVLAAVSLVILALFAFRKTVVAGRVGSAALRSDGHLSAIGAAQAAIALAGTAAATWLGWSYADAIATAVVGVLAVAVAVRSWWAQGRGPGAAGS